ncbi:MAG: fumarylacetoacetate hydrolase family protein [Kiritimatiellales bacterium]
MYFATYEKDGAVAIGVLTPDKRSIIPLAAAERQCLKTATLPETMLEFLDQGQSAVDTAGKLLAQSAACPQIPLSAVRLLAPIPRPRKNIFCIGKNYVDHILEFDKTKAADAALPKHPVIFSKPPTAVIGPDELINSHSLVTRELDYEVELAVVIGKKGTCISREQAEDYIFGYTILNDVTARDLQKAHMQWFRGKGLDTFAPMGPYLVHKSAVADAGNLPISLKVNGEIRQSSNTSELIFKIPELIATISAGLTLEPGDIIATGTPAGVGMGFTPPRFLKKGDRLELSIGELGVLKNTVG